MQKRVLDNSLCYSLTSYVLANKGQKDVLIIFNEWVSKENVMLDYNVAIWSLGYIKDVQHCDEELLRKALEIDKKALMKNNYGKGWN